MLGVDIDFESQTVTVNRPVRMSALHRYLVDTFDDPALMAEAVPIFSMTNESFRLTNGWKFNGLREHARFGGWGVEGGSRMWCNVTMLGRPEDVAESYLMTGPMGIGGFLHGGRYGLNDDHQANIPSESGLVGSYREGYKPFFIQFDRTISSRIFICVPYVRDD